MFSPSLQRAVAHDYVQPMGIEDTQNGITVRVEHVIVDQKQVNIFYTIHAEEEMFLLAECDVWKADKDEGVEAGIVYGNTRVTLGELRHIHVDMGDQMVPSQMRLLLDLHTVEKSAGEDEPTAEQWEAAAQTDPAASFDLLMAFDPYYTAQGSILYPDQVFTIDGNTFTVEEFGIYPTHIRLHIDENPENESWIQSLWFEIRLEDGTQIGTGGNSISAWGDPDTPSTTTYLAESSYFFDSDCFQLVITGADFLEKDFGRTYVNLETGQAENVPVGHEFVSSELTDRGWELKFRHPDDGISHVQVFGEFYDSNGERISTNGMWRSGSTDGTIEEPVMQDCGYYLTDYSGTEVWLEPNYTYAWYADEPIIVEIEP